MIVMNIKLKKRLNTSYKKFVCDINCNYEEILFCCNVIVLLILLNLFSGVAAAFALGVTIAFIKKKWDSNLDRLKCFMLLGCFIQLAGVTGFVAYLVLAITQNKGGRVNM